MTRTVWKHPIQPTFVVDNCGPVVFVALDGEGTPCLWAEHVPGNESVGFTTHGTGHPLHRAATDHAGSFVVDGLVFHVYRLASTSFATTTQEH